MKNTWFFTCSFARIKFVRKNTVALQRLKVNCFFLAESRQNVNSSWLTLLTKTLFSCMLVQLLKHNCKSTTLSLYFFTDKREEASNKTFVDVFQRTSKCYVILDSWKLKMFQWIISRSDLGFYQICKAFYR